MDSYVSLPSLKNNSDVFCMVPQMVSSKREPSWPPAVTHSPYFTDTFHCLFSLALFTFPAHPLKTSCIQPLSHALVLGEAKLNYRSISSKAPSLAFHSKKRPVFIFAKWLPHQGLCSKRNMLLI